MYKNALTPRKISLNYTWLLCGKNFRLNDAFSGILELEATGQQLEQKDNGEKRKLKKKKNPKA